MSDSTDPGIERSPVFSVRRVRCECAVCGSHTIATVCVSIAGCCGNCGSYDLRPIATPESDR